MANHLYEFTMKILRDEGCDLPSNMQGAYVPCYVGASDYQAAIKEGVSTIKKMNYIFNSLKDNVREIPIDSWDNYILKVWPEFIDHFPSQDYIASHIDEGVIFFGPFAGF